MCDLQNNPVGLYDDDPPHVTLTPPTFDVEGIDPHRFIAAVRVIAADTSPFVIYPVGTAEFGPNEDVPVTLVEDLRRLHERLIICLGECGYKAGVDFDSTYTCLGSGYKAHTSHVAGFLPSSEPITLTGMTIVRKALTGKVELSDVIKFGKCY